MCQASAALPTQIKPCRKLSHPVVEILQASDPNFGKLQKLRFEHYKNVSHSEAAETAYSFTMVVFVTAIKHNMIYEVHKAIARNSPKLVAVDLLMTIGWSE